MFSTPQKSTLYFTTVIFLTTKNHVDLFYAKRSPESCFQSLSHSALLFTITVTAIPHHHHPAQSAVSLLCNNFPTLSQSQTPCSVIIPRSITVTVFLLSYSSSCFVTVPLLCHRSRALSQSRSSCSVTVPLLCQSHRPPALSSFPRSITVTVFLLCYSSPALSQSQSPCSVIIPPLHHSHGLPVLLQ